MGLLTDPGVEKSRLPPFLHNNHHILATLFYIIGIIWFLVLAHNKVNHGTYFSENALLAGLVKGQFDGDLKAHSLLQSLDVEAKGHPDDMPYAWIAAKFTQLGLETYTHNFTLRYPMSPGKVFKGKNVYAILRSVRGSSTESFVVSAPYRPPSSVHSGTSPSIALMLSLAQFFSEQVYWAKDIIFLVTEHEQLGAQAWLEAYHLSQFGSGALESGDLKARAGPIQAAINLEIESSRVSHIDVKIEGLNGQLPNLDIVNLVHRLCHRENVVHTFKNRDDPVWSDQSLDAYVHQLQTLMMMVSTQATGVPNGNHGLFHRFGIAAVTLQGIKEEGRVRMTASLLELGKVIEGICRSLNNLLERFHQSFFFYLLPSTNRYISIGVYMPPFGCLGGSLLVVAMALWYSTTCAATEIAEGKNKSEKPELNYTLMVHAPTLILMHCVGLLVYLLPQTLAHFGKYLFWKPEDSIITGFIVFSLIMLVVPVASNWLICVRKTSYEVIKCVVLLELAVVGFATAVHNFSLALIFVVLYAPLALTVSPSRSWWKLIIRYVLLLLIHPLSLLYSFVFIDTFIIFPDLPYKMLLTKAFIATKRSLMHSVVDELIYGNWVFPVCCLCALPIWLILWTITVWPTPLETKKKVKTS